MPDHLHAHVLHTGETVAIFDVACSAHQCSPAPEEYAAAPDIIFPRRGLFVRESRSGRVVADANSVVFANGHESFRVHHPLPGGDDCTALRFAPRVLLDGLRAAGATGQLDGPAPFDRPADTLSPAGALACQRLRRALRAGCPPLAAEEAALQLLRLLLRSACAARSARAARSAVRGDTQRAHRDWVAAAREVLSARYREPLTLAALADHAGCSPYHLAHIFRAHTGLSLHRFQVRLRLAAALERLVEDHDDLTALALDLGFSSHSHFSNAFKATFGVQPSALRGRAAPRLLRAIRKNLQA